MRWFLLCVAVACVSLGATLPAAAVEAPKQIALDALEVRKLPGLEIHSSAFAANGAIPLRYSDYGGKVSPALAWAQGPQGTKSYVAIVDDPDAKPKLVNHWTIFNLPADTTELPEDVPGTPTLTLPKAAQGTNTHGSVGYRGPRPPPGDAPHHYHFQIFALDRMLELPPAPDRELVLKAMQGHVLAAGEVVGTFQR